MSIICIAIEQKIDLPPFPLRRDFQLAPSGFRSIEFGNVDRWFPWLRSLQRMKKDLLLAGGDREFRRLNRLWMAPIRTAAVFPIALPGGAQERVGALS